MIPYTEITEIADRSWTFRLLERLTAPDLPEAEQDQVVEALCSVSDCRSFGPLEAIDWHGLPLPSLVSLLAVDHLDVQKALGKLGI